MIDTLTLEVLVMILATTTSYISTTLHHSSASAAFLGPHSQHPRASGAKSRDGTDGGISPTQHLIVSEVACVMMRVCITSVVHETQMQTCSIWLHSDSYNCLIWTTSCPKSHRSHAPPMSNYDRTGTLIQVCDGFRTRS